MTLSYFTSELSGLEVMKRMKKCNIAQDKTKEWLEKYGYLVHVVAHGRQRFTGKTADIFGLWDIICLDPKTGYIKFFQVRYGNWGDLRKHKEFARKYHIIKCFATCYFPKTKQLKIRLLPNGKTQVCV